MSVDTLIIRRPDDWHAHFRDGPMMRAVVPATASVFARALAMPNLVPPVLSGRDAQSYATRIAACAAGPFEALPAVYLTHETDPDELSRSFAAGLMHGVKWYPAGATTHSDRGVHDPERVRHVLERMEADGIPLLVHGEVTDAHVDAFDRESMFLDTVLLPLVTRHPRLRVIVEHATTLEAVQFVRSGGQRVAATITPHHLFWDRNALFDGGLRPHAFCRPLLKRRVHTEALRDAATSGDGGFFAGTDTAPHPASDKERDCGCAGIFCAPTAIQTYAEVFDDAGCLDKLESFLSEHGAGFYRKPLNEGTITLVREAWSPPATLATPDGPVRIFRGGDVLRWKIEGT